MPTGSESAPSRRLTTAQQALAAQWSGLPRKLAREATPRADLADLLEESAHVALCNAAATFDSAKGVQFSTYAWKAVFRACQTRLAQELAHEERYDGARGLRDRDALSREDAPDAKAKAHTGWGALTGAVQALPESQRAAVERAYATGDSLTREERRALRAALAALRGEVVASAVGEGPGEARETGTGWTAEEEAFLWRVLMDVPTDATEEREDALRQAASRLGRPLKGVRRKAERLREAARQATEGRAGTKAARRETARARAVAEGWELHDGGFFGQPLWVRPATGETATQEEMERL